MYQEVRMSEETKPVAQITYVTRPVGYALPESQIKIHTITHLMPVMWERSVKRIATLAQATIIRGDFSVIVQFPKGTLYDEMKAVTERILEQAQAVSDQREEARKARTSTDDESRQTKVRSSRLGKNVPVRVAPQRRH
jgi:hypothetical protein